MTRQFHRLGAAHDLPYLDVRDRGGPLQLRDPALQQVDTSQQLLYLLGVHVDRIVLRSNALLQNLDAGQHQVHVRISHRSRPS
jgi:hypothetical protein